MAGCSAISPPRATRRAISTRSCSLTSTSTTCGASVTTTTRHCCFPQPNSSPARPRSPFGAPLADKLPPAQQPRVTQVNLKLATPRLRLIKAMAEVVPGVTTFGTPGHTPGHLAVNISSGREELLLTGDVVVNSAVSFLHPEWPFGFDVDVPLATKTRMAFLDRAAADKTLVGSYHLPFPGFGHVVREGSAYRWLPADWQWTT